jgi:hypothetical protein
MRQKSADHACRRPSAESRSKRLNCDSEQTPFGSASPPPVTALVPPRAAASTLDAKHQRRRRPGCCWQRRTMKNSQNGSANCTERKTCRSVRRAALPALETLNSPASSASTRRARVPRVGGETHRRSTRPRGGGKRRADAAQRVARGAAATARAGRHSAYAHASGSAIVRAPQRGQGGVQWQGALIPRSRGGRARCAAGASSCRW